MKTVIENLKKIAEDKDEVFKLYSEMYWSAYQAAKTVGFTDDQAFKLCLVNTNDVEQHRHR